MAVRVRWTGYGEAASALREEVAAAKGGEALAPVTVVVSSNHVGVAMRRLLASGRLGPVAGPGTRGLAAVTFATVYRLAEMLGAPALAAAGRRPVSTPVVAAAVRSVLADGPGVFAPIATHPATESALVSSFRELRDLPEQALDHLSSSGSRAAEVVRVVRAARARLAAGWFDEEDLLAAASTAAERGTAAASLGAVVVHLPQTLSLHAGRFLAALGRSVPLTVVAGTTGHPRADAEVVAAVGSVTGEPAPGPVPAPAPIGSGPAAPRVRVLTASDAEEEVRGAVAAILESARAGTSLDRMAILHATPEPYSRLVHEHLGAAGIPANGAATVPLTARVVPRTLLRLLALAEDGFRREDVFAWLAGAPLVDDGGRPLPVADWERHSRAAAVIGGRHDWDLRLARWADRRRRAAEHRDSDSDTPPGVADHYRREADSALGLRAFVLGLIDEVDGVAVARPWSDRARWARRLLDRLLGEAPDRSGWPDAETRAVDRLDRAIDRLAALDAVEPAVGLDVFTRTLELELGSDLGRTGRFGEGVLVGGIPLGVGLDLDVVVVLGLAEGSYPAPVRDDSLLPDDERRKAAGLPLRRDRVDQQHRHLLAAMAASTEVVLSVPRGDLRRSSHRVPSRWVLDAASALHGSPIGPGDLYGLEADWVAHRASFAGALAGADFPATAQEHRLRTLLALDPDPRQLAAASASVDPATATAAEALSSRRSPQFTRFDGNLAGVDVVSPTDAPVTVTQLQMWAACPYAYLAARLLGVRPVENPEEALRITPIDLGNLVHDCLEEFALEVLARPNPPRAHEPWTESDRRLLASIGARHCDRAERDGRTGRPIFWTRDRARIMADLDRFLDDDSRLRASRRSILTAAEMTFGGPNGSPPVTIVMAGGRTVSFTGRIDRIDVADDGTVHVTDYKTGKPRTKPKPADPTARGTQLQLPVYAEAARRHLQTEARVVSDYRFVTSRSGFVTQELSVDEAVAHELAAVVGRIVDGIENGVFPHHPTDTSSSPYNSCHYCNPDSLGVTELRRQWEAKRSDPAMARYADLAEPVAAEGSGG